MTSTSNLFTLFSLQPAFALDADVLAEKKRGLLSQTHPDARTQVLDLESRQQAASAEHINQAYQVLASPDTRAAHLLALHGVQVDTGASIGDLDFLGDALELREDLDDADDASELDAIKKATHEWLCQLEDKFAEVFDEKSFTEAGDTVRKMAFLVKLLADINNAYDDLDDDLALSADLF